LRSIWETTVGSVSIIAISAPHLVFVSSNAPGWAKLWSKGRSSLWLNRGLPSDRHQHGLYNAWPLHWGSRCLQVQTRDAVESKGSSMSGFHRRQLLSIRLLLSRIKFCQSYTDTGGAASKRLRERKREVGEASPFGARTGRYQSAPQHLQFLRRTRV